jgi:uncharacterized protein YjbI with pentapeptide repeats
MMKKSKQDPDGKISINGESYDGQAFESRPDGSVEKQKPPKTLDPADSTQKNSQESENVTTLKEKRNWLFENISEASKNARQIYFLYVSFLAYCVLTVFGTSDRQMIFNDTTRLPIVGLDVSLNGFFILAPLLAIFIFIYFQLYLSRIRVLSDDLSKTYEPPDTMPKKRLYPWIVNIAEDPDEGLIGKFQMLVVRFSFWWMLPIVLMLFSLWISKKHETGLSYLLGLFLFFGTVVVLFFWRKHRHSNLLEQLLLAIIVLIFGISLLFFIIPWAKEGIPWNKEEVSMAENKPPAQVELLARYIAKLTNLDLSYQKLITEPKRDYGELFWQYFRGIHLEGAQLQSSVLMRAFLRDTKLKKANLDYANLEEANLQGANLEGAKLEAATLRRANLGNAILREASLGSANLFKASLLATNLEGASLVDADLRECALNYANLQGANLSVANLQRSMLEAAKLQGANLQGADLQDSNLHGALLSRANLKGANLESSNLQETDLESANLENANLEKAKLQNSLGLTAEQLCKASTLYQSQIDTSLMKQIQNNCPHLLKEPKHKK